MIVIIPLKHEYKLLTEEIENFCCPTMEAAYRQGFIKFSAYDGFTTLIKNLTDRTLNIFKFCWTDPPPQNQHDVEMEPLDIKFCPFCAEKIEYVEEK